MAKQHIQIEFVDEHDRFTPAECLELAQRAESLHHQEWAQHWLDQALIEERHLQHTLGLLDLGV